MADLLRAFLGSGLAAGIGGYGRKIKRFGETDEPEEVETENFPSLPLSPSLNRSASSEIPNVRSIPEDPVASAEDDARRNLPITLPEPLRRPSPPLAVTSAPPQEPPASMTPAAPALRDWRGREITDRGDFERDQYMRAGRGDGGRVKRSLPMTLLNAFIGAGMGARAGGGLGALSGAATGTIGSIINPEAGCEMVFEQFRRPGVEAEMAREKAARDRANMEIFNQAKLDDLRAETGERHARTRKLGEPTPPRSELRIGANRTTGERRFYNPLNPEENARFEPFVAEPAKPRPEQQPTAAELSVDPESGMSVEETADASYMGRGGDRYVFDRLPPRTRQILAAGTVTTVDGKTISAMQTERDAAQKEFERAVGRQRKTDLDYTRGHIRGRRLGGGKSKTKPSGSQPTANLRDLENLWR